MNSRQKNNLYIFIIIALTSLLVYLIWGHTYFFASEREVIDSSASISSFIGDLFAGLMITILATFLIPTYLDWRKRPILEFKNRATRNEVCILTKNVGDRWEGTYQLMIQNIGAFTQQNIYWHIIIPNELEVSFSEFNKNSPLPYEIVQGSGKLYKHFSGEEQRPIWSKSNLTFPYEMKIKTTKKVLGQNKIYYYFSTEFGTSPRRMEKYKQIERKIGKKADDAFKTEYLSHLLFQQE